MCISSLPHSASLTHLSSANFLRFFEMKIEHLFVRYLLKPKAQLFSDTKTLNATFRAGYYDQQLHFISTFCLEVMYLKT